VREVRWSVAALEDLESVLVHIAADNPTAAFAVIDKLETIGTQLGEMATGRKGRVSGTYEKPVVGLPYILAYAIETRPDGTERIVILRIIYGARDWPDESWPKE
jgi:toxin ParE1/3/4